MQIRETANLNLHGQADSTHRLRILCLHGYRGNADVLRAQMRALMTGFESFVDFVCVDAPSLTAGDFGWWHAVRDETPGARGDPGVGHRRMRYQGWERTRDWLISLFEQRGPFDGVFGFSQGAALTALLVGLRAPDGTPTRQRPLSFDFAMMIGGFVSNDPRHAGLYGAKDSFDLPSLHIIGSSDGIVPSEDSRELAARFKNPLVIEHEGGHVIASDASIRSQVRSFLEEMLRRRASQRSLKHGDMKDESASGVGRQTSFREPVEVPLWQRRERPSMKVFFPNTPRSKPSPAILVFRGGAYATSAGSGGGAAEWVAAHGMVGIEVQYRTQATQDSYPASYADAARAVRLVRHRAAEWGIDGKRVGVMGFSAGGHLASLLSTQPTLHVDPEDDLAAHLSARPDLVILAYPLISFIDQYAPGAFVGSAENFFGRRDLSESLRRLFSSELHVNGQHPPVFVWTTMDDALVPYTHAKRFAEACQSANVPVTFKHFPHGPHGMGLALGNPTDVGTWTSLMLAWIKTQWGAGENPAP
jgi:acetyl esterase/lipase